MTEHTEALDPQALAMSLTGFDELAIEKAFSCDLDNLPGQKATRALAFILFRRQGMTDADAKAAMMEATQGEVLAMFGVTEDELFPDDPETDQGKDASATDAAPSA